MNVELIAYTPEPESVCNLGAKVCVSYDMPESGWDDFKSLDHALASGHESVLEHATFTFAIEGISRACSHQLVRHRMASYSQQSQRYVKMDGFDYVVPESIQKAITNIQLGYVDKYDPDEDAMVESPNYVRINEIYSDALDMIGDIYEQMIKAGIPEEDARYILPNACKTNIVVTMNARELRHFFSLRCCERAQWEIKQVAEMMLALVREVAPTLFENAGPRCKQMGFCPEKRGCGKMPKKVVE